MFVLCASSYRSVARLDEAEMWEVDRCVMEKWDKGCNGMAQSQNILLKFEWEEGIPTK